MGTDMAKSPYERLPPERFWRTGVAERTPKTIEALYRKRFEISKSDAIATAGSCFAQHIARHMRQRGCNVLDVEPPPPGLDGEAAKRFGFNLFSARYGNLYTARQLLQLVLEAFGERQPVDIVWTRDGRCYDALRPGVEPNGHARPEDVLEHRAEHLAKVRNLFETTELLIFTFGLTETWQHRASGTVYPTAPGTIAGEHDPAIYELRNLGFRETLEDFRTVRQFLKGINPDLRSLITVSPVPLTATATDQHVLVATTYSKSVLRAVCGQLYAECPDLDYFPSYELIASPFSKGAFFEPNLRSVTEEGVRQVMDIFFAEHAGLAGKRGRRTRAQREQPSRDERRRSRQQRRAEQQAAEDVVCEEAMLDAFGR
jgi:hypothetical protein